MGIFGNTRTRMQPTACSDYLADIKAKAAENATARANRHARRRKLLVDQMRQIQQKEVRQQSVIHFSVHQFR